MKTTANTFRILRFNYERKEQLIQKVEASYHFHPLDPQILHRYVLPSWVVCIWNLLTQVSFYEVCVFCSLGIWFTKV